MVGRRIAIVLLVLVLTGCAGPSATSPGSLREQEQGQADAATPSTGTLLIDLHFSSAPQKGAHKQLPDSTSSVRVWVLDPATGQQVMASQTCPLVEGAGQQRVTLFNVPPGTHELVLQALDSQQGVLGYCARSFTLAGGATQKVTVDSDAVDLESLAVSPDPAEIALSTTLPLTARASFSDRSTVNVTGCVDWTTADSSIAAVSQQSPSAGVLSGLKVGTTSATALLGSASARSVVYVRPKGLAGLTVSPASASIPLGLTQPFVAVGQFDDGTSQDLTHSVAWTSSSTDVATVTQDGTAIPVAPGATTIRGSFVGFDAAATLTVEPHALVSLALSPSSVSVRDLLETAQVEAIATYTDGQTADVSTSATWTVGDAALVSLDAPGLVRGNGHAGSTTVRASLGSASAEAPVTLRESIVVLDGGGLAQMDDMSGAGFRRGMGDAADLTGHFDQPAGVCLDAQGRIYAADRAHRRITRMDDFSGANFTAFGGTGTFIDPTVVRVDSAGRIYVLDAGRIVRMDDMAGQGWTTFGADGSGVGEFSGPYGLCLDASDRIYVGDTYNGRIVRFDDMNGTNWTTLEGVAGGVVDLFVDAQERLYYLEADACRVVRVNGIGGAGPVSFGTPGSGAGQLQAPYGLTVDPTGRIYVCDSGNNRIVRVDDMGAANPTSVGVQGSGTGQFLDPWGVTCDAQGRVYVADWINNRIVRLENMDVASWATFGTLSPYDLGEGGMAVDSRGRLYVADRQHSRVIRVDDLDGRNLTVYALTGDALTWPDGVAIDSHDRIYVLDAYHARVFRMDDMAGTNLVYFGSIGFGVNQFQNPKGIFIDSADRIYVSDYNANRVVRFDDMSGTNWTHWGETWAGPLGRPMQVRVDASGRVYVSDTLNARLVRVDDMSGANLVSFPLEGASCLEVQAAGRIYFGAGTSLFRMDEMTGTGLQELSGRLRGPWDILVR